MDPTEPVFGHIEAISVGDPDTPLASARASKQARVEQPVVVRFGKDSEGLLDQASTRDSVWLDIMKSLQAAGRPVYVEIDRRSGRIVQFLQPREQPIGAIQETAKGDAQVELLLSHAIHALRRNNPRYGELLKRLREAQHGKKLVWVTETLDTHEILEVR